MIFFRPREGCLQPECVIVTPTRELAIQVSFFPLFSFSSEIHLLLLTIQVSFYTNVLIFLQTNIAKTKVTLISLKQQGWSLAEKIFSSEFMFLQNLSSYSQIFDEARKFAFGSPLRAAIAYGGGS